MLIVSSNNETQYPEGNQGMSFQGLLTLLHSSDILALCDAERKGVNFTQTDPYDNRTLLIAYSLYGYSHKYDPKEVIDFLLRCGIDINHQMNKRGNNETALHKSVSKNNREITTGLIERNADIEIQDKNGNSPLIKAVMNYRGDAESLKIITLLISKGASLDSKNTLNNSARSMINMIGGGIDAGHNDESWDLRALL